MTATVAPPLADPRPVVVADDAGHRLDGVRCTECGHPCALRLARCVRCRGAVAPARFGPAGTVWAMTVVHVAGRPGDTVPYTLAYVDLDDGPRVLTRLSGDGAQVGARAVLTAATAAGDPAAEVVA